MNGSANSAVFNGVSSGISSLQARWLPQPANWMTGAIKGRVFQDEAGRQTLAAAVIDSIEVVDEQERAFSSCTDGRQRQALLDGLAVPVREQLVGTDTVAAFVAAEALGERFYGKDDLYAPVERRIVKVVEFLTASGYRPTAHIACGAAGGFTTVLNRATQFIDEPQYIERLKQLVPDGVYDSTLHRLIVGGYQSRLDSSVYDGYHDGLICEIVEESIGQHGVERYIDDGQGVHGHLEQAVVYLDPSIKGLALNPNKLIAEYGIQVFAVNSRRADAIARLFSRGGSEEMDYKTARLAIEDFAAAGHGTLAYGMETLIISAAA
jgi:hypothetical protein